MDSKISRGCFYQVFPVENIKIAGWGNCSECIPDSKNGDCKGHFPVAIIEFIVHKSD